MASNTRVTLCYIGCPRAVPSLCSICREKPRWFQGVFIEWGLKARISKLNQTRMARKRSIYITVAIFDGAISHWNLAFSRLFALFRAYFTLFSRYFTLRGFGESAWCPSISCVSMLNHGSSRLVQANACMFSIQQHKMTTRIANLPEQNVSGNFMRVVPGVANICRPMSGIQGHDWWTSKSELNKTTASTCRLPHQGHQKKYDVWTSQTY